MNERREEGKKEENRRGKARRMTESWIQEEGMKRGKRQGKVRRVTESGIHEEGMKKAPQITVIQNQTRLEDNEHAYVNKFRENQNKNMKS